MPDILLDIWYGLPAVAQDVLLLLALLLPVAVIALVVLRGFAPAPLLRALVTRHFGINAVFVALIACAVGVGAALIVQERALRAASADAANPFPLVIGTPGSETTLLFSSVYLQPNDVGLIDGPAFAEIAEHPRVAMAAPLAFGDSWQGAPVVGTIAPFIEHLAGAPAEGRLFETYSEAVVGSQIALALGDGFEPAHGIGDAAEHGAHEGTEITVVGRMARTGTPWDRAILVPAEQVWETHGLGNGHALDQPDALGPPYEPQWFPGTPAALVVPTELYAAYSLREQFTRNDLMAILPAAVLSELHGLMGDVRAAASVMTVASQVLVAVAVLAGLALLTRLFARQLALLRALGAPRRFIAATLWSYAALLIGLGAVLGLVLALALTGALSSIISERTGLAVSGRLGWAEIHLVAAFVSAAALAALLPVRSAFARNAVEAFRG